MNFSQFMELKFIEWQHQVGGRKTVLEFATYLGIAQTTASSYMNGKRIPEGETVNKLAEKLGMEIYDSLNLEDLIFPQLTDDEGFWLKLVQI